MSKPYVLITGATGYVGGRLKTLLEEAGYPIRCHVRSKSSIPLSHSKTTEYFVGDFFDQKALSAAFKGVDIAYYLIQTSIEIERELATRFAEAAARAKVKKIIYLGVLGNSYEEDQSSHIKNRHEIGHTLRANSSEVQVMEFRTSIVIGSGSLSFEMIRSLIKKSPWIVSPKWFKTEAQAIAVQDLLAYLMKAIDCQIEGNPIFEIGGKSRLTYEDLLKEAAHQKGKKLFLIPIPFFAAPISWFSLSLTTPLYLKSAKKLVQQAICQTVVHDPLAAHLFKISPLEISQALRLAWDNEGKKAPETRWNDAASAGIDVHNWSHAQFGGRLYDLRKIVVNSSPELAFEPIKKIGGQTGYYGANWIWRIRGMLDFLIGGVGCRRGRRDAEDLKRGDPLDFWRVISYRPNQSLKLLAEVKTPGRALLEFRVLPHANGAEIQQKVMFDPIGIGGILYWYLLYPIHKYICRGMIRGIAKKIEENS